MAVVLVLICGCFGFTSAVMALLLFDASLLQALLVWTSSGFAVLICATATALLSHREPIAIRQVESA